MGAKPLMVYHKRIDESKESKAPEIRRYLKRQAAPDQLLDSDNCTQFMTLTAAQRAHFRSEKLNILQETSNTQILTGGHRQGRNITPNKAQIKPK